MNYPQVNVIIPTMNRDALLTETMRRLSHNLSYPGDIHYLIGNDGETGLAGRLMDAGFCADCFTVLEDGKRKGLGGNYNRLIQTSESDIILSTQDDYFLTRPLDLTEHVTKLLEDETAGWIRLRLTQGQNFTATVHHRYWHVSWHSEGYYIASDQPHLVHKRFHAVFGYYPEGLKVGDTENTWCWAVKALGQRHPEWPQVLIPVDWPGDSSWVHMGEGEFVSLKEQGL